MLQTGSPTATLYSANPLAGSIVILAPTGWHDFLAGLLQNCFDRFILVDLLDDDLPGSIQQIPHQANHLIPGIVAIIPRDSDLQKIGSGPCWDGTPVGLLPVNHPEELIPWFQAIQETRFQPTAPSYQILSMWKPFYIQWANRFVAALKEGLPSNGSNVIPLFADETSRDSLCHALWNGPKLALYVGHGRSRGWSGYRGFRWEHLAAQEQVRPVGALMTITCDNLKPGRAGEMSFGERWVLTGRAGAFFGATDSIKIKPLQTIARSFLSHFSSGEITNLGQLISFVDRDVHDGDDADVKANWSRFRIIGNPLQQL